MGEPRTRTLPKVTRRERVERRLLLFVRVRVEVVLRRFRLPPLDIRLRFGMVTTTFAWF